MVHCTTAAEYLELMAQDFCLLSLCKTIIWCDATIASLSFPNQYILKSFSIHLCCWKHMKKATEPHTPLSTTGTRCWLAFEQLKGYHSVTTTMASVPHGEAARTAFMAPYWKWYPSSLGPMLSCECKCKSQSPETCDPIPSQPIGWPPSSLG